MEQLIHVIDTLQGLTNEWWRYEIYYNDNELTYKLYCPSPENETYHGLELSGKWLQVLINNKHDHEIITRVLENELNKVIS